MGSWITEVSAERAEVGVTHANCDTAHIDVPVPHMFSVFNKYISIYHIRSTRNQSVGFFLVQEHQTSHLHEQFFR
jgi:hypothetical protein